MMSKCLFCKESCYVESLEIHDKTEYYSRYYTKRVCFKCLENTSVKNLESKLETIDFAKQMNPNSTKCYICKQNNYDLLKHCKQHSVCLNCFKEHYKLTRLIVSSHFKCLMCIKVLVFGCKMCGDLIDKDEKHYLLSCKVHFYCKKCIFRSNAYFTCHYCLVSIEKKPLTENISHLKDKPKDIKVLIHDEHIEKIGIIYYNPDSSLISCGECKKIADTIKEKLRINKNDCSDYTALSNPTITNQAGFISNNVPINMYLPSSNPGYYSQTNHLNQGQNYPFANLNQNNSASSLYNMNPGYTDPNVYLNNSFPTPNTANFNYFNQNQSWNPPTFGLENGFTQNYGQNMPQVYYHQSYPAQNMPQLHYQLPDPAQNMQLANNFQSLNLVNIPPQNMQIPDNYQNSSFINPAQNLQPNNNYPPAQQIQPSYSTISSRTINASRQQQLANPTNNAYLNRTPQLNNINNLPVQNMFSPIAGNVISPVPLSSQNNLKPSVGPIRPTHNYEERKQETTKILNSIGECIKENMRPSTMNTRRTIVYSCTTHNDFLLNLKCKHIICKKYIEYILCTELRKICEYARDLDIESLNKQSFSIDCPKEGCFSKCLYSLYNFLEKINEILLHYNVNPMVVERILMKYEGVQLKFALCQHNQIIFESEQCSCR